MPPLKPQGVVTSGVLGNGIGPQREPREESSCHGLAAEAQSEVGKGSFAAALEVANDKSKLNRAWKELSKGFLGAHRRC